MWHKTSQANRAMREIFSGPVGLGTACQGRDDTSASYLLVRCLGTIVTDKVASAVYVVKPDDFAQLSQALRCLGYFWGIANEPPPAPPPAEGR